MKVFGHRAEGHRQKDVSEGQTFSKKVNEQILPEFLSIADDTTMKKLGKAGIYWATSSSMMKACRRMRVVLVDHGVLKDFEMSRSPLVGICPFERARQAAARGNTGFTARKLDRAKQQTVTNAELRAKLIELIKAQGKPFGC